jgi:hypothetical protein
LRLHVKIDQKSFAGYLAFMPWHHAVSVLISLHLKGGTMGEKKPLEVLSESEITVQIFLPDSFVSSFKEGEEIPVTTRVRIPGKFNTRSAAAKESDPKAVKSKQIPVNIEIHKLSSLRWCCDLTPSFKLIDPTILFKWGKLMSNEWVSPEIHEVDFSAQMECACECGANAAGSGSGTGTKIAERMPVKEERQA